MARFAALLILLALACAPAQAADQGRQIIRDDQGRRVGTVEPGIGERQVIRDNQGRRGGTVEPGIGGRQVIRDGQGRRLGTLEPQGR